MNRESSSGRHQKEIETALGIFKSPIELKEIVKYRDLINAGFNKFEMLKILK